MEGTGLQPRVHLRKVPSRHYRWVQVVPRAGPMASHEVTRRWRGGAVLSPRTAKPSGSARALYLALVARGLVVTIVRGDTILVRGIDRLCCEAHRNWVRQHIPPHKPEL